MQFIGQVGPIASEEYARDILPAGIECYAISRPTSQLLYQCILQAEHAGTWCEAQGWAERPTWADLAAGLRPPVITADATELGEWQHGWQYFASNASATAEWEHLMRTLALPSTRVNAVSSGKLSCTLAQGGLPQLGWLPPPPVKV